MKTCLNCNKTVEINYCSHCGQSIKTEQITFRETFINFLSLAFSFENKFSSTIKKLITNPGILFRDYLKGKRQLYYKPITFFILTTALYIFLRDIIDYKHIENI